MGLEDSVCLQRLCRAVVRLGDGIVLLNVNREFSFIVGYERLNRLDLNSKEVLRTCAFQRPRILLEEQAAQALQLC